LSLPVVVDADSAAAWLGTTLMTCVRGHYGLAIDTAQQALALSPPPVGAMAALFVLGWASYVVGRVEEADRAFAAMEQLFETDPETNIAGALSVVGVAGPGHEALVAHILGDDAKADRRLELAKARAADAPISLINVELSSCWLACMRGDVAASQVHAAACAELADRLHYPLFTLQAAIMGGWADAMCGDIAGAARADAAYADLAATGIRLFLPLYLLLRAEAHEALHDPLLAADLVREARVVSAEVGDVCLSPRLTDFAETLVPSKG
jgi:tetratricopeptide (TPR) repeat protein